MTNLETKKVKHPSIKDKLAVYEDLLHAIQLHAEVTMNNDKMKEIINRVCRWSYAHRSGNGENSEKHQQEQIDHAFWQLDLYKRHGNEK